MKIIFFGTPDYILPILDSLTKNFKEKTGQSPIQAVVTKKPKPSGRKKTLTGSAVDIWARKRDVPVFFNPKDLIKSNIQADIGVLACYGQIIPQKVIDFFPHGIINVHPSLLPKYRGSTPVVSAIALGEKKTGVTIIKLDTDLDHGPIISQFEKPISPTDKVVSLRARLYRDSAKVLTSLLPAYSSGKVKTREQDHDQAIYTRKVRKTDTFISPQRLQKALEGTLNEQKWAIPFIKNSSLNLTPEILHNYIRAMEPWPIVWTEIIVERKGKKITKRLKIFKSHLKNKKLVLDQVQLEGKKIVSWVQFQQGYPTVTFE